MKRTKIVDQELLAIATELQKSFHAMHYWTYQHQKINEKFWSKAIEKLKLSKTEMHEYDPNDNTIRSLGEK